MVLETLLLFLVAEAPTKPPPVLTAPAAILTIAAPAPDYQPDQRAVANWRLESALALEMGPIAAARRALALDDESARCVKLNNYWCIKRAGWNGEIAADGDGHVAFASAEEGAAVAALLLHRYYVDYRRHTARAIVERWAPAQCSPVIGRVRAGVPASRAGMAHMMPQRIVPMGLAPRGIQNTLRARWLAAHGRGGVGGIGHGRSGLAADLIPAPSIMEGVADPSARRRSRLSPPRIDESEETVAAIPLPTAFTPARPLVDCSSELARIANYAAHAAEGVATGSDEDLKLFTPSGQPTANLARMMANMAAVEIGPARPRSALVIAAIAQLRRTFEDPSAPPTPASP